MPGVLGWRGQFGVIAPSTNTVVEADFTAMHVPGVTVHMGRIAIADKRMGSDSDQEALQEQIRQEMNAAIKRVATAEIDMLIMGMSAETFWGGVEGAEGFIQKVKDAAGVPVITGADSCREALEALGVNRIGVVTPYQAVGDANVRRYFDDIGVDVLALHGLRCPTATAIAEVPPRQVAEACREVAVDGVEAIIQVGTNLSALRLADTCESWLGVPMIAINAAIWWSALRRAGLPDVLDGFGPLLAHH
jgi:maleate isomerase